MKISKVSKGAKIGNRYNQVPHPAPMLVSSVLGKCIKTLFFSTHAGNFSRKFLSRYAYQDAANHIFEKRKDYCLRYYEVLRVLINYNGIIRNDIEANIQFYRVGRVIPQKYYIKFIKNKLNSYKYK